ncbi:MAG: VOC family protein [Clostridiales bacterium]|nr:VOC family protein [Clostridiales bacterium]
MKQFVHATIQVKDLNESLEFYQEIVGLPIANRFISGDTEIVFLGQGDTLVELIYTEDSKDTTIGDGIALGFGVDCLEDTIDFIKDKGIEIHSGPFEPSPTTKFFYVQDPDGLKIQFIEQK